MLGFNSGKYDLKVIKKYFVTHIGTEDKVTSGQQARRDHVISTLNFKFLDICNYVGPSKSYEQWVKTYGSSQTNSWLLHEWLNSMNKLDHEGFLSYRALVLQTEKQVPLVTGGVQGLQESICLQSLF